MIKVTYTPDSLVKGNYPDSLDYPSITINEEAKTILNAEGELLSYIEIEENKQIFGKTMCIKNGVYQEFIKPDSKLLQEAKDNKIAEIKSKASSLIIVAYPMHTQLNYLAEVSTIQDKQINSEVVTQEELDFLEQAKNVKAFINGIRTQSKNFTDQVNSCSAIEEVNNIDITF